MLHHAKYEMTPLAAFYLLPVAQCKKQPYDTNFPKIKRNFWRTAKELKK